MLCSECAGHQIEWSAIDAGTHTCDRCQKLFFVMIIPDSRPARSHAVIRDIGDPSDDDIRESDPEGVPG